MRARAFLIYFVCWCAAVSISVKATEFTNESLNYRVMYKWGLINKQAGHATLSLKKDGGQYELMLAAASEPWADKFYKVRDTLVGAVEIASFRPLVYKKFSHEGGEYRRDEVKYSYSGSVVTGAATRKHWDKKNVLKIDKQLTLTAEGLTVDMLSSFYYMRNLPFNSWKPGHKSTVNLFSGKRKEILTITYLGEETIEMNSKRYSTFHISFSFTDPEKPSNETSDPMDAWISTEKSRIPLKLEGKLPVGKVQCFFIDE